MTISFIEPLERAWGRMRGLLFAPFSIERWAVVGFSAWLAGIVDGNGGHAGSGYEAGDSLPGGAGQAWEGLLAATGIALLAFALCSIALVLLVVLLWLSSRAKFVFLDNLVTGRTAISAPWSRYGTLGDSLFIWRLVFHLGALVLIVALVVPVLIVSGVSFAGGWDGLGVAAILYLVAVGLAAVVVFLYVTFFLDAFVIPIMYRMEMPATQAWRTFMPTLRAHLPSFLFFGVINFVLSVAVGAAMLAFGLMTCCVGFVILALPYVGIVVTLPVWVTFRYYSLEFLAQFDPRFDVLGTSVAPAPPPAAPSA